MINNRMISSQTIIAKLIADLDLSEDKIRITDIKEWLIEGMLKIGAIQQYDNKVATLPIVNHLVSLPCDLYKMGQVAYSASANGGWVSMRKSTSSFGVVHDKCGNRSCMIVLDNAMFPLVKDMFNLTTDVEALEKLNSDKDLRKTLSMLLNQWTVNTSNGQITNNAYRHTDGTMYSRDLLYMTKPGYIMTSMSHGYVKIEYYAIFTDDEGMPMIPDAESYKEALFWYLAMKLLYPKHLRGEISQGLYYDIRRSWNFYCKQAYGDAMMPGADELESIKNDWHKLYPEFNDHDSFFSTTGDEQLIYNQNR